MEEGRNKEREEGRQEEKEGGWKEGSQEKVVLFTQCVSTRNIALITCRKKIRLLIN